MQMKPGRRDASSSSKAKKFPRGNAFLLQLKMCQQQSSNFNSDNFGEGGGNISVCTTTDFFEHVSFTELQNVFRVKNLFPEELVTQASWKTFEGCNFQECYLYRKTFIIYQRSLMCSGVLCGSCMFLCRELQYFWIQFALKFLTGSEIKTYSVVYGDICELIFFYLFPDSRRA